MNKFSTLSYRNFYPTSFIKKIKIWDINFENTKKFEIFIPKFSIFPQKFFFGYVGYATAYPPYLRSVSVSVCVYGIRRFLRIRIPRIRIFHNTDGAYFVPNKIIKITYIGKSFSFWYYQINVYRSLWCLLCAQ